MSDDEPLRIALVAEGPTDRIVLDAALSSILGDRRYILRLLQPEDSLAFAPPSASSGRGKGWGGVCLWCRNTHQRGGGTLRQDLVFETYDLLIVHLDADVAGCRYSDCGLPDDVGDLPCDEPCPPPSTTVDRLRCVILRWVGETELPPHTVLCIPSKSTETWVVAALFPDDKEMQRKGWECHPNPATRLAAQPKSDRLKKTEMNYRGIQDRLAAEWPRVCSLLGEAERFSEAVRNSVR